MFALPEQDHRHFKNFDNAGFNGIMKLYLIEGCAVM